MTLRLSLFLCLFLSGASGASLSADVIAKSAASKASFSTTPSESVLLLGDLTVASTSGLTQSILPRRKTSANPIISQTEHFKPNAAAEVKYEKFVLRSANRGQDDGGGTSQSGAWTAKRVQA